MFPRFFCGPGSISLTWVQRKRTRGLQATLTIYSSIMIDSSYGSMSSLRFAEDVEECNSAGVAGKENIMRLPRDFVSILGFGILTMQATHSWGQDYPYKPVRFVTTGIASASDVAARLIAQGISKT